MSEPERVRRIDQGDDTRVKRLLAELYKTGILGEVELAWCKIDGRGR
ncbi:hypothetical protein [Dactylosporangium fulvum]|uniref:Uncharacterized protein n=1 Tax=Dactylosporangium fulvum TaxID=53359 RepID=A0ABY5VY66_9ACTN|nr:hypothetical protein [Dactylosporangium fulvum]UWP80711.1 hypothetical protein Dfulv_37010 [Dactylosporangium fulvum]